MGAGGAVVSKLSEVEKTVAIVREFRRRRLPHLANSRFEDSPVDVEPITGSSNVVSFWSIVRLRTLNERLTSFVDDGPCVIQVPPPDTRHFVQ